MEIKTRRRLQPNEQAACMTLLEGCHQHDGTFHQPYLDNLYNFDRDMPAFLLATEGNDLLGFLTIYADEPGEAQLEIFVAPAQRHKGIATALLEAFKTIATVYQLTEVSYTIEQVFLDENPDLVKCFQLKPNEERELWLTLACQKLDLAEREDLQVTLARMEQEEEIAHFQAAAFGLPLDYARHYARESIQSEESRLYILESAGQVLASVTVDSSLGSHHFYGLAVLPSHQRQGLASYLLQSLINRLGQEIQQPFQIVVEKENHAALNLYQKLGFSIKTEILYLEKV